MLDYLTPDGAKLTRVKPGLMFLLRLAWESRTRLPLIIMSCFLAMGIRIQMEINIDRTRYIPRVRLDEEAFLLTDGEDDGNDDDDSLWALDTDEDEEDVDDEEEEDEFDSDLCDSFNDGFVFDESSPVHQDQEELT